MGKSAIPQVGKPNDFEAMRQQVSKPVSLQVNKPASQPAPKPTRQILEGYVKGGVVHLLEGELPDGIFVKIIKE